MVRLTAESILREAHGQVDSLVSADVLQSLLGDSHPLFLPMSLDGKLLHDFSALELYLEPCSAPRAAPPQLPLDLGPLLKLCRHHRRQIRPGESWSYRLYYLELLARERRLQPLFWGNVEVLAPAPALYPPEVQEHYRTGARRAPPERRSRAQELWANQAPDWIRTKVIVPVDERPWLAHLQYVPPAPDPGAWDAPELTFADRLRFIMQPFYHLASALPSLHRSMTEELWQTSIFCPRPLSPENRAEWRNHSRRFAIQYRRCTAQWQRQQAFEAFVKQQHAAGHSAGKIAGEAVAAELWPYGTPREEVRTPEYCPGVNCERAVYRVVKKMAQGKLRGAKGGQG